LEKRPQKRGDGLVAAWMSWHSEDVGDGVPAPVELPVADSAPVDRLGFGQWGGGGCGEPRVLFRQLHCSLFYMALCDGGPPAVLGWASPIRTQVKSPNMAVGPSLVEINLTHRTCVTNRKRSLSLLQDRCGEVLQFAYLYCLWPNQCHP